MSQNEKVVFTRRLHAEGRYDAYVLKRESLKLEGVDPVLAWRVAAAYFPPLNGKPHEVSDLPPIPDPEPCELDASGYIPDPRPTGPKPCVYAPAAAPEVDFPLDASTLSGADLAGPAPVAAPVKKSIDKPAAAAEPDPTDDPETEDYSDIKERGEKRIEKIWRKLYRRIPKKRKANPAVVADWIFNNADADVEELHSKDVPSRGALTLLKHVKSSPGLFSSFIKETWVKTMPSRQEMIAMDQVGDKHKTQHGMLDAFIEDFEAREAERERQEMLAAQERA